MTSESGGGDPNAGSSRSLTRKSSRPSTSADPVADSCRGFFGSSSAPLSTVITSGSIEATRARPSGVFSSTSIRRSRSDGNPMSVMSRDAIDAISAASNFTIVKVSGETVTLPS